VKYAVIALSGKPRRFSGFLHSIAMELAPGMFLAADFDRASFSRVWQTLEEWHARSPEGWIVAVLPAAKVRHPPELRTLGVLPRMLIEQDGLHLVKIEQAG
jgi:CRISPR-associated protein Cas2